MKQSYQIRIRRIGHIGTNQHFKRIYTSNAKNYAKT